MRNYLISICILAVVVGLLLTKEFVDLCASGGEGWGYLFFGGAVPLPYAVWSLVRAIKGKIVSKSHYTVALDGGRFTLPEPESSYEL
jgi:hypothetical protein